MPTITAQLLTGVFFATQGVILLLLLVVAHRVRSVKRQMQNIVAQVEHYLAIVLDSETPQVSEQQVLTPERESREEEENRLISAVLREIFP
jgi:hypothetical protein